VFSSTSWEGMGRQRFHMPLRRHPSNSNLFASNVFNFTSFLSGGKLGSAQEFR
jgi:hypothetical protein